MAGQLVGHAQAPATTGPARGPRPASSTPINALKPSMYFRSSKAKVRPTRFVAGGWLVLSAWAESAVDLVSLVLLLTAVVATDTLAFDLTAMDTIALPRGCAAKKVGGQDGSKNARVHLRTQFI